MSSGASIKNYYRINALVMDGGNLYNGGLGTNVLGATVGTVVLNNGNIYNYSGSDPSYPGSIIENVVMNGGLFYNFFSATDVYLSSGLLIHNNWESSIDNLYITGSEGKLALYGSYYGSPHIGTIMFDMSKESARLGFFETRDLDCFTSAVEHVELDFSDVVLSNSQWAAYDMNSLFSAWKNEWQKKFILTDNVLYESRFDADEGNILWVKRIGDPVTSTPEPSTLIFFAIGSSVMVTALARRKKNA